MDFSKLRAAALQDGEDEEAVTVDTRALIDKVLARYSGEWTTLRELIQNAADAQATTVKIKWETHPSTTVPLPAAASGAGSASASASASASGLSSSSSTAMTAASSASASSPPPSHDSSLLRHTIQHHTLRRLLVENDGVPFAAADWARLKRIADGNPDETKIGAFGVGFYSVFADCEEPFVSSGGAAMAFYWKGNALFTRKLKLPAAEASKSNNKTTFVLDYRNATTALPNLLSISQFLATSLTFVALSSIEFWIDDWKILVLNKVLSPGAALPVPPTLDVRTKDGLMSVLSVEQASAQIDAVYMNAVAWSPAAAAAAAAASAASSASASSAAASASKSTDSYGMSSGDVPSLRPSLRSFFSRLTETISSTAAASAAQARERERAAREEKAAQDALLQNLTACARSVIFLRVMTAQVQARVGANFASELERATKKPPPKVTRMAILTSSYADTVATEELEKAMLPPQYTEKDSGSSGGGTPPVKIPSADIFASVLPGKKLGGRVFIGFPTMQTTGAGMHISAPSIIPTVEREAIDLNARWVRNWNMELLRVAGILTRLAFASEMADMGKRFRRSLESSSNSSSSSSSSSRTNDAVASFAPEALHILRTYTFADSTPSGYVGQIIEEAFWTAYKTASFDIFSTAGVVSTDRVRIGDEQVSRFASGIPSIVPSMRDNPFMQKLVDFGVLRPVDLDDIRAELEARPLSPAQLASFLQYLAAGSSQRQLDRAAVQSLLRVAVASGAEGEDTVISLGSIRHFLAANKIPVDLPLPPSTMPFSVTRAIPQAQLVALGWTPLELLPWLEYLVSARDRLGSEHNLTESPVFAGRVLAVLSTNWDNLSSQSREAVASLLRSHATMPTRVGMRRPQEAYFASVKLFDDLPVLAPHCHSLKERFLAALGVRKTLDLDTIFARLVSRPAAAGPEAADAVADGKGEKSAPGRAAPSQSHVELVRYLASVRDDIPAADLVRLRESYLLPAEAGPPGAEWTVPSRQLYRPRELFRPDRVLRDLGMPIMQWPGPPGVGSSMSTSSREGALLVAVGLRLTLHLDEVIDRLASPDRAMRERARAYFFANRAANGYQAGRLLSTDKAIVPVVASPTVEKEFGIVVGKDTAAEPERLARPANCFLNPQAAILGFPIVHSSMRDQAAHFGVQTDPPVEKAVARLLANLPHTVDAAVDVFAYLSTRLQPSRHAATLRILKKTPVVPVVAGAGGDGGGKDAGVVVYAEGDCFAPPDQCFTDPRAAVLGFAIVHARVREYAAKFGVLAEPPVDMAVRRLLARPPQSREEAVALFSYFSTRVSGDSAQLQQQLSRAPVVPIVSSTGDKKSVRHVAPQAVYLGSSATYGDIFDFVDFGPDANAFLFRCGSRSEPTKAEIAHRACAEPARLLSTLQSTERYLGLLRSLAADFATLRTDAELLRKMQTAPFLLASKEVVAGENSSASSAGADDAPVRQYQLAAAGQIAVLDDYISYRLFKDALICAPEEDVLESFYAELGAQMLSKIVEEDVQIMGRHGNRAGPSDADKKGEAQELRKFVLERSKIFLYEYQKYRHNAVKRDYAWLEQRLVVERVQSVALRRSLRGGSSRKTHVERRSAASVVTPASLTAPHSSATLYLSSETRIDMYQVGQAVCQLVLRRPNQQAYFFFEPFLKLDLLDLRGRGYNVDRILRAKQVEAQMAEEERRRALEAEQKRMREEEERKSRGGWGGGGGVGAGGGGGVGAGAGVGAVAGAAAGAGAGAGSAAGAAAAASASTKAATPTDGVPKMPGAFDDSPPSHPQEPLLGGPLPPPEALRPNTGNAGGLFANLTRRLGLEGGMGALTGGGGGGSGPRPGLGLGSETGSAGSGSGPGHTAATPPAPDDGRVTSPAAIRENMLSAIQASRPYGSSTLFSPPRTHKVKEQATYCDSTSAHDLRMVAEAPRGMSVFLAAEAAGASRAGTGTAFLAEHADTLAQFEAVLLDVAAVYQLRPRVVHIFYDEAGPTIAFNQGGSIFCNLRYFAQLHAGSNTANARAEATVWWWVVVAHELAHNLETSHNAQHSYYTESFVQQYFYRMASRVAAPAPEEQAPGTAAPPSYEQATGR